MYKIKIKNNQNIWEEYQLDIKNTNNDEICFRGNYFGSSSRIGILGTIYDEKGIYEKIIKILYNHETICTINLYHDLLKNHDPNNNQLSSLKNIHKPLTPSIIINTTSMENNFDVIIHLRDLHRWKYYPYEICQITLKKKKIIKLSFFINS